MESVPLHLIDVIRPRKFDRPLVGHFWRQGKDFTLISELGDDLGLNGLSLVITKSIKRLREPVDRVEFYSAILGVHPPFRLDILQRRVLGKSIDEVVAAICATRMLVAVHMEIADPDVCYVGRVVSVTKKIICLDLISSCGKSIPEIRMQKRSKITKIEIGTRYLRSLEKFLRLTQAVGKSR